MNKAGATMHRLFHLKTWMVLTLLPVIARSISDEVIRLWMFPEKQLDRHVGRTPSSR
jgi:hypothetical protein